MFHCRSTGATVPRDELRVAAVDGRITSKALGLKYNVCQTCIGEGGAFVVVASDRLFVVYVLLVRANRFLNDP